MALTPRGHLALVGFNAGVAHRAKVTDLDQDYAAIDRLFEINFHAGLKLASAYPKQLSEADAQGRFMATASETSLSIPSAIRNNRVPHNSACKNALMAALEWLAIEQQEEALSIHVLIPGAIYTPMISGRLKDPANLAF